MLKRAHLVIVNYRGFRIEAIAAHTTGAWDVDVTIGSLLLGETACTGRLPCRKSTAQLAEQYGADCARRWVDRNGQWFNDNYRSFLRKSELVPTKPCTRTQLRRRATTATAERSNSTTSCSLGRPVRAAEIMAAGETASCGGGVNATKPLSLLGINILIVDDDPRVRGLYAIVLREAGATVTASGTASEAVELSALQQPDVVVTDLVMPGHDGVWLFEQLSARISATPVIVVTGDADAPNDDYLVRLGFAAVLRKPVILSRLTDTVGRLVQRDNN